MASLRNIIRSTRARFRDSVANEWPTNKQVTLHSNKLFMYLLII
jgi:hypothetical protein